MSNDVPVFLLDVSAVVLVPDRDLVNVSEFRAHERNSSQLMNLPPLSESMPRIGNGNDAVTPLITWNTHFRALFFTERVSVHPVAMSVRLHFRIGIPCGEPHCGVWFRPSGLIRQP